LQVKVKLSINFSVASSSFLQILCLAVYCINPKQQICAGE
jgi:hypothetical protein